MADTYYDQVENTTTAIDQCGSQIYSDNDINLTAATGIDIIEAATALLQQTAAAAASTATYGFNVGLQLDIDATKTDSAYLSATAVASTLSGNNIQLATNTSPDIQTNIQGSNIVTVYGAAGGNVQGHTQLTGAVVATTAETSSGNELKPGTSNLNYSNSQQNSASNSLATLGHGNISVGGTQLEQNGELTEAGQADDSALANLNRDTTNTTKALWNSDYGQELDVSLDHRLLTEEGRAEIAQQYEDAPENIQKIAQNVPNESGGNALENFIGTLLNDIGSIGILPSQTQSHTSGNR